jgi:hypothetical protein
MGGLLSNKRHEPKMRDNDGPYISLIHAKAESYSMAFNLDDYAQADLETRRDELHSLLSPSTIIELCNAWKKLQHIQKQEEAAELEEMAE